jgi:hypothetical protein
LTPARAAAQNERRAPMEKTRMPTRLLAALLAVALVAAADRALAKPNDNDAAAAREHYKRGLTLYDLGKYDEAVVEFEQAYELKDEPVLLYNIGQALRLNSKYTEAMRFYRTYLKRKPNAPNREEVEQKIASLEELIEAQKKMSTAPPPDAIPPHGDRARQAPDRNPTVAARSTSSGSSESGPSRTESAFGSSRAAEVPETHAETPPPNEGHAETPPAGGSERKSSPMGRPGRLKLIVGIVVAAVGVAALAAGIGLGAVAASDSSAQEMAKVFNPDLQSEGQTFSTVGLVMDIIGGAAIAAGVTVAVLGILSKPEKEKVTLAPSVGRGSAGASLTLHF